jgi:hypothetical protein
MRKYLWALPEHDELFVNAAWSLRNCLWGLPEAWGTICEGCLKHEVLSAAWSKGNYLRALPEAWGTICECCLKHEEPIVSAAWRKGTVCELCLAKPVSHCIHSPSKGRDQSSFRLSDQPYTQCVPLEKKAICGRCLENVGPIFSASANLNWDLYCESHIFDFFQIGQIFDGFFILRWLSACDYHSALTRCKQKGSNSVSTQYKQSLTQRWLRVSCRFWCALRWRRGSKSHAPHDSVHAENYSA